MAIAFRAAASANNAGGATTLTIAKPTGVVQDDVMVAVVSVQGGTNRTITAPSGWTLIRRTNSTTALAQATYWKVAGATEPANYTWTFDAAAKAAGIISAYSGANTTNPVDAENGQANASSLNITAPGVTTSHSDTMLVFAGSINSNAGGNITPPTGMTERGEDASGSPGANRVELADAPQAAAGASGDKVATAAGGQEVNIGHLVALAPAPLVKTVPDSAAGIDSATVGVAVAVADSTSGVDTVAIPHVKVLLSDVATPSEAVAIPQVMVSLQDTATPGEAVTIPQVEVLLSDVATPVDGAAVTVQTIVADAAGGVETVAIPQVTVLLSDAASPVDAVSVPQVTVLLSDAASPSDTASVPQIIVPISDVAISSEAVIRILPGPGSGVIADRQAVATIADRQAVATIADRQAVATIADQ